MWWCHHVSNAVSTTSLSTYNNNLGKKMISIRNRRPQHMEKGSVIRKTFPKMIDLDCKSII